MEKGSTDEWLSPKGAAKGKNLNNPSSSVKKSKKKNSSSSTSSASTSSSSSSSSSSSTSSAFVSTSAPAAVKKLSKSKLTTRQKSPKSDDNLVQTILVSPEQFTSPPIRTTFTRHTKPVKLAQRTQTKIQDFFAQGKPADNLRDSSSDAIQPEIVIEIPSTSEGEPDFQEFEEEAVEDEEPEETQLNITRRPQPARRRAPNFDFQTPHEGPSLVDPTSSENQGGEGKGEDSSMEQFLLDFMEERESDFEVIEPPGRPAEDNLPKPIHATPAAIQEGETEAVKRRKKRMPVRRQDDGPTANDEEVGNNDDDDVTEDESSEKTGPAGFTERVAALSESEYQGDYSSDDTLAPSPLKSVSIHAIPLIPIPKWSQESLSQPEGPSVSSQQHLKSDPESSPIFGLPFSKLRRSQQAGEPGKEQRPPPDQLWDDREEPKDVLPPANREHQPFKQRKRVRIDDVDRVEESIQPGTQDSVRVLESPLFTSPKSSPTKRQSLGGSLLVPETQEILSSQEYPTPKRRSVVVALETQGDFSMAMSFPQPPGWDSSSDYHSPNGPSSQD